MSVYREPPECTDDIYPGLSVWEERVSGSLTIKNSRLPLWAFVWPAITKGWEEADSGWGLSSYGYTADDLGQFLYYLFDLRGEFARLIAVLADVERLEDDRNGDVSPYDYVPWPQDPELRGRVVDQLRRCLSALESTEEVAVNVSQADLWRICPHPTMTREGDVLRCDWCGIPYPTSKERKTS